MPPASKSLRQKGHRRARASRVDLASGGGSVRAPLACQVWCSVISCSYSLSHGQQRSRASAAMCAQGARATPAYDDVTCSSPSHTLPRHTGYDKGCPHTQKRENVTHNDYNKYIVNFSTGTQKHFQQQICFITLGWHPRSGAGNFTPLPPEKGHRRAGTLHHHTQREDASVATLGNPKSSK